jgi:GntR family transcriptional regulator
VRTRNKKIIAYTIDYFPIETGNKISKKDILKKNLLYILEEDLKISLEKSLMTIEATFADKNIAKKLKIDPGAPLLFSEIVMYDDNHKPVEFIESVYPAEAYKYVVNLKRDPFD